MKACQNQVQSTGPPRPVLTAEEKGLSHSQPSPSSHLFTDLPHVQGYTSPLQRTNPNQGSTLNQIGFQQKKPQTYMKVLHDSPGP